MKNFKKNSFLLKNSNSEKLWKRACNFMPGGNARSTVFYTPRPAYADSGSGCYIKDVEGEIRVDFINNYTSLAHGHAYGPIIEAVSDRIKKGTAFAWPLEEEVLLAEIIVDRLPYVEHIRFTNSGSEAVLHAIKGARAYTGKSKIAKFEGCYHGNYDAMMVSFAPDASNWGPEDSPVSILSNGDSQAIASEVIILPFNNLEATVNLIRAHQNSLAAVIIDPMPVRAGLIPAEKEFLLSLKEVTRECGVLLISDEVISFRASYNGAQGLLDYQPDLTTLAKIIGGGFPVGAFGGRKEIMSVFDPSNGGPQVEHMGTFSANPVTMVAGIAALEGWTSDCIEKVNNLGELLRVKGNELIRSKNFDGQITGVASLFHMHMTTNNIKNYRDQVVSPNKKEVWKELHKLLLDAGVIISATGLGCISTPMAEREIDTFLNALEYALNKVIDNKPSTDWLIEPLEKIK